MFNTNQPTNIQKPYLSHPTVVIYIYILELLLELEYIIPC